MHRRGAIPPNSYSPTWRRSAGHHLHLHRTRFRADPHLGRRQEDAGTRCNAVPCGVLARCMWCVGLARARSHTSGGSCGPPPPVSRDPCSRGSRAVCSRSQPSHPSIKMAAGAAVGGRAALPLQPPIVGQNRRRVFEYLSKVFITHDSVAPSLFIFMIERRPLYSYS